MLTVLVRVRPGASRTVVGGSHGDGGQRALVVAVTARPVDGEANDAVCAAVADAFGVRRRHVDIVSGQRSRTKVVRIDVDEIAGRSRLGALLE